MLQITDSSILRLHDAGLNSQKKSRRDLSCITFKAETWKRRIKRRLLAEAYISDDLLFVGTLRRLEGDAWTTKLCSQ